MVSPYENISNPQTIWARVENAVGCGNFTSFELIVTDPPHFDLAAEALICLGEEPIYISPTLHNPTSVYTYSWVDSAGNEVSTDFEAEIMLAGTYALTVTTAEGCEETQSITVNDSEESSLSSSDLIIVDFAGNNTMTIPLVDSAGIPFGIGDYQYAVDTNNDDDFTTNLVYENLLGGSHTLFIRDENGCPLHEITFSIVDYMRFFTPNGDGVNDYWQLLGSETQPGAKIHIFDRFGKLLAKIKPGLASDGWDGTFNGHDLPSTDYWFSEELENGRTKKGHFSLVRR